jgi:hypothetical protein
LGDKSRQFRSLDEERAKRGDSLVQKEDGEEKEMSDGMHPLQFPTMDKIIREYAV